MNHEHWVTKSPYGSKACVRCGEKFDVPIRPIDKSDILKGGEPKK